MKDIAWKKISEFEGPEESPGYLLWQVSLQWRRQIESALSPLELTHAQFVVLASLGWLTKEGTGVTQIELARHASLDIAMTSQVLRTLEKKGLIKREHSKEDARSKLPKLTKSGALMIEKAIPLVERVDQKFFSQLKKETKTFKELLQKLCQPS